MSLIKATHNGAHKRTLIIKDDLREYGYDVANWIHLLESGSAGELSYCKGNRPGCEILLQLLPYCVIKHSYHICYLSSLADGKR